MKTNKKASSKKSTSKKRKPRVRILAAKGSYTRNGKTVKGSVGDWLSKLGF
jgi:hypothetical protein